MFIANELLPDLLGFFVHNLSIEAGKMVKDSGLFVFYFVRITHPVSQWWDEKRRKRKENTNFITAARQKPIQAVG